MKDLKVCIRGAGDLATGIGLRMYNSGFNIVMTDIEIPTTVRRTVAFSRAVYEKSAVVEGVEAVFCKSLEDIKKAHSEEKIAVIVDLDKKLQKDIVEKSEKNYLKTHPEVKDLEIFKKASYSLYLQVIYRELMAVIEKDYPRLLAENKTMHITSQGYFLENGIL